MFAYLKSLALRLRERGLDTFFPPPEDPSFGVREPRKHGPGGRSSSAAVAEPVEHAPVRACGSVDNGRTVPRSELR
jgi:hypothetical protein